ncbi:G-type lectin S-receptor-like serine/threonine-protein kinase SD2-5 [Syzygium oleosum]|uniref:G-type lectin S-receptor-like serine/threonine-protein kinase SD2-5 n=1 Tax=Syzygium oleosum TaxID=219896 RepID=UPI0024BB40E4|nr:G-type lectin S-receptor-like serine/threonine-protein kinase SD2-5 [Syzygium oleosum]
MKIIYPFLVWFVSREFMNDTAQLRLTQEGNLVLLGDHGKKMWSTNTAGKSVVGLNLTEVGNLVLYDRNDAIVWQSFDHPANVILPGQELRPGMKLTATSSAPDGTARVYTFTTDDQIGFVASVRAAYSPQIYYRTSNVSEMKSDNGQVGALYKNRTFGEFELPLTSSAQFIYLGSDGHLMLYAYDEYFNKWNAVDLLDYRISDCDYPLVCGSYGICSDGPHCQCPSLTKQIEERNPSSGCKPSSPISCDSLNNTFKAVENVTFFALWDDYISVDISNTTAESCKEACLRKGCSCTMALFNQTNSSVGDCYLLSDSFSLIDTYGEYSTLAFIKVNNSSNPLMPLSMFPRKRRGRTVLILGTTVGAVLMFLVSVLGIYISSKVRRDRVDDDDSDLPRLQITRFLYEDLKAMTGDFNIKLGEGGFGSVFLGTLPSGIRIAVKRLEGFGQLKKSFLAEAGTIGTIHHVNLVRLLGFCAEKSRRLLVYEYMCNGSLDKWIFHDDQEFDICWQVRRKIILDIAKGLAYLHEECHQKIIHLDIKPQNILLDEHFNAKLADFGLSKLIDKDQSHVMTTMRGTPGYLAPEWLSSIITEKVDVYSFGIVILEVLCGRKNVDRSLPSDEVHMLTLFKCKAEQEQLLDMVDKSSGDMQLHGQEAVKMMKMAAWCLQDDCSKRPAMSQVVKCLESSVDIEDGLRYSFSVPSSHSDDIVDDATQLLPSQLSGPR